LMQKYAVFASLSLQFRPQWYDFVMECLYQKRPVVMPPLLVFEEFGRGIDQFLTNRISALGSKGRPYKLRLKCQAKSVRPCSGKAKTTKASGNQQTTNFQGWPRCGYEDEQAQAPVQDPPYQETQSPTMTWSISR
jgi:hypothetical protein